MRILRPREKKKKRKEKKNRARRSHTVRPANETTGTHFQNQSTGGVVVEHFQKLQAQEATFGGVRERTETERREQGSGIKLFLYLPCTGADRRRTRRPTRRLQTLCGHTETSTGGPGH